MATIETIKKNNTEIKIGIGILTKNPMEATERDLKCHRNIAWIYYDGYWYHTSYKTVDELRNRIIKSPTYTKEQLFYLVYEITC